MFEFEATQLAALPAADRRRLKYIGDRVLALEICKSLAAVSLEFAKEHEEQALNHEHIQGLFTAKTGITVSYAAVAVIAALEHERGFDTSVHEFAEFVAARTRSVPPAGVCPAPSIPVTSDDTPPAHALPPLDVSPVSAVMEWAQAHRVVVSFECSSSGTLHAPSFTVLADIPAIKLMYCADGSSKKEAKRAAAAGLLRMIVEFKREPL